MYEEPRLCLNIETNTDSYVNSKQIAKEPQYPAPAVNTSHRLVPAVTA
jgi:hypothetical protein